jgi:hypothetical protein
MQIAYKERFSTVIIETMASIPPNVYLPRRFKGNESFWLLAEAYSIELHESSELGLQKIYLSSLLALFKIQSSNDAAACAYQAQGNNQRESDSKDNRFIKQSYLWLNAHIAEDLS